MWIDYLLGKATREVGWLDVELGRQRLGITDLILCEVLQGARTDKESVEPLLGSVGPDQLIVGRSKADITDMNRRRVLTRQQTNKAVREVLVKQ